MLNENLEKSVDVQKRKGMSQVITVSIIMIMAVILIVATVFMTISIINKSNIASHKKMKTLIENELNISLEQTIKGGFDRSLKGTNTNLGVQVNYLFKGEEVEQIFFTVDSEHVEDKRLIKSLEIIAHNFYKDMPIADIKNFANGDADFEDRYVSALSLALIGEDGMYILINKDVKLSR